jgi:hypothetical protein
MGAMTVFCSTLQAKVKMDSAWAQLLMEISSLRDAMLRRLTAVQQGGGTGKRHKRKHWEASTTCTRSSCNAHQYVHAACAGL